MKPLFITYLHTLAKTKSVKATLAAVALKLAAFAAE